MEQVIYLQIILVLTVLMRSHCLIVFNVSIVKYEMDGYLSRVIYTPSINIVILPMLIQLYCYTLIYPEREAFAGNVVENIVWVKILAKVWQKERDGKASGCLL